LYTALFRMRLDDSRADVFVYYLSCIRFWIHNQPEEGNTMANFTVKATASSLTINYGKTCIASYRNPSRANCIQVARNIGPALRAGITLNPSLWNRSSKGLRDLGRARCNRLFGFAE